ncbi:MAG: DMT family transporter [Clostridia bacterium]|nr:DMT family transporter [Clostridia bacterium]
MNPSYLLVLLGVAMVSYSGPLVKGALLAGANPVSIAMLRMAFSALLLLPILCVKRRGQTEAPIRRVFSLTRRQWLWSVAASLFLAFHYLTWMTSLDATSTFASVALVCTQPLFVAAVSGVVLREPMPKKARPGAAVALVGAMLIGLNSLTGLSGDITGDLLALLGAACMAGHWLCNRYARRTTEAMPFAFLLYAQTALLLLIMSPLCGGIEVTPASLWYILGLAAGCTLLGHQLFTIALGKVSATVVSFAILGEPVGAMLWSMLMFGEVPTVLLLIGGAVTILGLTLYLLGSMKHEEKIVKS